MGRLTIFRNVSIPNSSEDMMVKVKLTRECLVGDAILPRGSVVSLPEKLAERYTKDGAGVPVAGGAPPIETGTAKPVVQQAVAARQTGEVIPSGAPGGGDGTDRHADRDHDGRQPDDHGPYDPCGSSGPLGVTGVLGFSQARSCCRSARRPQVTLTHPGHRDGPPSSEFQHRAADALGGQAPLPGRHPG